MSSHSDSFVASGNSPTQSSPDFAVRSEGTIWLFEPQPPAAFAFLSEHIQDDAQYFGPSLVVNHSCVYDLLIGLRKHGLRTACQ
jgi:hypothetical protein